MPQNSVTVDELMSLLDTPEAAELGPGPRRGVQSEAELSKAVKRALHPSALLARNQELLRGLILLWHDHLESAHVIAQGIEGPDGAFVHGIMHRREPDYGNAKYWFRRVGQHPAFRELASKVALLPVKAGNQRDLEHLVKGQGWDAFAMVDACEQAAQLGSTSELSGFLRQVQKVETEVLLSYLASPV